HHACQPHRRGEQLNLSCLRERRLYRFNFSSQGRFSTFSTVPPPQAEALGSRRAGLIAAQFLPSSLYFKKFFNSFKT
ncbi:hypothetical protein, partial [Asticcacaulis sp. W401b]|uniref:hypothetical protein n=1 Tax=Asticcacaulis sp. W401b TaxID=3388666 RepID=UPI0039708AFB